jgi:hypothetical protein
MHAAAAAHTKAQIPPGLTAHNWSSILEQMPSIAQQQQAYLKASNTDMGDLFGVSVAASSDTVVVAAPAEDSNATGVNGNQSDNSADASGAAYVLVRSGTTWSQQAYLKASNTGTNDLFGSSAAISGDIVVIAAQGEDSNAIGINENQSDNTAPNSGAACVRAGWDQLEPASLC